MSVQQSRSATFRQRFTWHRSIVAARIDAVPQRPSAATRAAKAQYSSQVVQISVVHSRPDPVCPWLSYGGEASCSSGIVVDVPQGYVLTTAGAVEHSQQVMVRAGEGAHWREAEVVAISTDADLAILQLDFGCPAQGGVKAVKWAAALPAPCSLLYIAGFSNTAPRVCRGPASLVVMAGVASHCAVTRYAHSGRHLLALHADVAAGRGCLGAGAFDSSGNCVGILLQRNAPQSWAERYLGYPEPQYRSIYADNLQLQAGSYNDDIFIPAPPGKSSGTPPPQHRVRLASRRWSTASPPQHNQLPTSRKLLRGSSRSVRSAGNWCTGDVCSTGLDDLSILPRSGCGVSHCSGAGSRAWAASIVNQAHKEHAKSSNMATASRTAHHMAWPSSQLGAAAGGWCIVPFTLVKHMLAGLRRSRGVCCDIPQLDLAWRPLHNQALKAWCGLGTGQSGVLVTSVSPCPPISGGVLPGDVITSIGGHPVADDGTITITAAGVSAPLDLSHALACKHVGDELELLVRRGGASVVVRTRCAAPQAAVPVHLSAENAFMRLPATCRRPGYLILASLGFVDVSGPLLDALFPPRFGGGPFTSQRGPWRTPLDGPAAANVALLLAADPLARYTSTLASANATPSAAAPGAEPDGVAAAPVPVTRAHATSKAGRPDCNVACSGLVALTTVLPAEKHSGEIATLMEVARDPRLLQSANGNHVHSCLQLAQLVASCQSRQMVLRFVDGHVVAFDMRGLRESTRDAMQRHGIVQSMPLSMRENLRTPWPG